MATQRDSIHTTVRVNASVAEQTRERRRATPVLNGAGHLYTLDQQRFHQLISMMLGPEPMARTARDAY